VIFITTLPLKANRIAPEIEWRTRCLHRHALISRDHTRRAKHAGHQGESPHFLPTRAALGSSLREMVNGQLASPI
jgi:hypothetical protein